jgi:hypothetical protein
MTMKKFTLLLFAPLVFSCANYEKVTLAEETPFYRNLRPVEDPVATIPANTEVMVSGKGEAKRVIYNDQKGYVVLPDNTAAPATTEKAVAVQK